MSNNKYIIFGEKYADELEEPIKKAGFIPFFLPDNPDVDKRLSGHADLSVFFDGEKRIYAAPFLKNSNAVFRLEGLGYSVIFPDIVQNPVYPQDAPLNIRLFGGRCIYSEKVSCREIAAALSARGTSMISVRQGYCACSVCALDDNAVITADPGIHSAAKARGIDSLLIRAGHIALEGFDYGFIGGAAFRISERVIAFTGRLDLHPDKEEILAFLKKYRISPAFLTDKPIFDIGSAIPLP